MQKWDDVLLELQAGLGNGYLEDNQILNVPGVSIAFKLDPNYYLAPISLFTKRLAYLSAKTPTKVRSALINTGNLITRNKTREYTLNVAVTWPGLSKPVPIQAGFIVTEFIERALRIHARMPDPLPVGELQIASRDQKKVQKFFGEKTAPYALAFA